MIIITENVMHIYMFADCMLMAMVVLLYTEDVYSGPCAR